MRAPIKKMTKTEITNTANSSCPFKQLEFDDFGLKVVVGLYRLRLGHILKNRGRNALLLLAGGGVHGQRPVV